MERVATGAHLPTQWLFERAKRLEDRADYYLGSEKQESNSELYS